VCKGIGVRSKSAKVFKKKEVFERTGGVGEGRGGNTSETTCFKKAGQPCRVSVNGKVIVG